jgi:hypothetical protein
VAASSLSRDNGDGNHRQHWNGDKQGADPVHRGPPFAEKDVEAPLGPNHGSPMPKLCPSLRFGNLPMKLTSILPDPLSSGRKQWTYDQYGVDQRRRLTAPLTFRDKLVVQT